MGDGRDEPAREGPRRRVGRAHARPGAHDGEDPHAAAAGRVPLGRHHALRTPSPRHRHWPFGRSPSAPLPRVISALPSCNPPSHVPPPGGVALSFLRFLPLVVPSIHSSFVLETSL